MCFKTWNIVHFHSCTVEGHKAISMDFCIKLNNRDVTRYIPSFFPFIKSRMEDFYFVKLQDCLKRSIKT